VEYLLNSEAEQVAFGRCFGVAVGLHALIGLSGELGSGKTTLVRGLLKGAGHAGAVKSPTFSLVEPYELPAGMLYHFDLYRLQDPEELEYIGIRDYLHTPALCVVEWPEKAVGFLPNADLMIMIEVSGKGRKIRLRHATERGAEILTMPALVNCLGKLEKAIAAAE
jgi:tRNA threonylcarbamoyladenosine biosynthesis protein TsaE